MLPTLGRYIREDALFALCCASLLIAGPVWFIFFAFFCFCFCAVIVCCHICSLTLFWFLFYVFIRYQAGRGLHGDSPGSVVAVNGPASG